MTPAIGNGLNQNGESWQTGGEIVRHLDRSRNLTRNLNFGYDFKSTNNNLEFSGSTVSNSNADLFQLRMGFEQSHRQDVGDYSFTRANLFVGPGGGTTDAHSTDAFETVRPGSSPDYVYGRLIHEESVLVCPEWQLVARGSGQVASERLLFSETLGLGGFDTIRGYDQRSYNADNGWTGSVEYGWLSARSNCDEGMRVFRVYSFLDMGNGYVIDRQPGEDGSVFALSTGLGTRYQLSDRLIARLDLGIGLVDLPASENDGRIHFGITWVPGPRP